jgi:hypothetical protein
MAKDLRSNNTLYIHQNINESYYLEKEAELVLLKEQLDEAFLNMQHLQRRVCHHYKDIYGTWRKDIQWLSRHLHQCPAREQADPRFTQDLYNQDQ